MSAHSFSGVLGKIKQAEVVSGTKPSFRCIFHDTLADRMDLSDNHILPDCDWHLLKPLKTP